jgi:membrane-bound serine protease (ClpP class)
LVRLAQILFALLLLVTLSASQAGRPGASATVRVIQIDAAINPATADYLHDEIARAREAGAECLVVRLNTPGGLLKSTRSIVADLLDAPLPVVVYVSPGGAQAASAGVFITLAAHVAAMAPGTNIGAAHPVALGGDQPDSIMMGKMTNDAAAFIRTISEKRHRNVAWAEDAVRKSVSLTEGEARAQHVIDCTAATVEALLDSIDGRSVPLPGGDHVLATKGASIVAVEKSFQQRMLDIISDPNIAYIFMMLGVYGLLFELYNPGSIVPGVVGVICLILGLYAMHTLPVNYAGLGLVLVGIVLFLLEIKITSYGLLTIGGIVALGLGSIMLFQHESGFDVIGVSWEVILGTLVFTGLFFFVAIGMGIRAQRRKPTTGIQGIIGERGEALTELSPNGQVRVHGEIWSALSLDGTLAPGTPVVVEAVSGLTLHVRTFHSQ